MKIIINNLLNNQFVNKFPIYRVVFSVLALLVTTATVHEGWRMYKDMKFDGKKDGLAITALHCFSILNNGRKLLSMKVSTSSDNFGCIHGIRVFSTVWVVMGHFWSLILTKLINPLVLYKVRIKDFIYIYTI